MKTRFNNYDIVCSVTELQKLVGLRVNQIYDIDNKTYLIRLQQGEKKYVLLLESGTRFHTTAFDWPKNVAPSGFSMKLRKHLKNKRLEKLQQLGVDRIVDFQFGTSEAAHHVILELYDKGNIILTDHELTILNILRPHNEGEEVRFAVRKKYPLDRAKGSDILDETGVRKLMSQAKPGLTLRSLLVPLLDCGPTVLEHVLINYDIFDCVVGGGELEADNEKSTDLKNVKKHQKRKNYDTKNHRVFNMERDLPALINALKDADDILKLARISSYSGYIIQKKETKPVLDGNKENFFYQNIEYQPRIFSQHRDQHYRKFDSFVDAVDEFYSTMEGQKIDVKAMQQERDAIKKLTNVKKDHERRLQELSKTQEEDKKKAELITRNQAKVDNAILTIRSALANQMPWAEIKDLVKQAQTNQDPVAAIIKQLKLEINRISLYLQDPYEEENKSEQYSPYENLPPMIIDIDLDISAFANARNYYDQKRSAAKKEKRTMDASSKALKSAERKTHQTLKEVRALSTISKARKVYWFEKFYWFISSENYLVIGGRDSQQNELIVKRYMRPSDIYVHAEIQGASSIVIRNPTGSELPPKTLLEAGTMAISYSVAWDAKVVTNAYWVKSDQVSKTAPSGEYLSAGSFMIRGKKNFLPPCHLIMGISLLFKLEESSIEHHKDERRAKWFEDDDSSQLSSLKMLNTCLNTVHEEIELEQTDQFCEDEIDDPFEKTDMQQNGLGPNTEQGTINNIKGLIKDNSNQFPDTHVKIEHDSGKVTIKSHLHPEEDFSLTSTIESSTQNQSYIIQAVPTRVKQQKKPKKKAEPERRLSETEKAQFIKSDTPNESKNSQSTMKRGQRSKLKKIREKYKDQDEEERQMRMEILKSAGKGKAARIEIDEKINEPREAFKKTKEENPTYEPKMNQQENEVDELDELTANTDEEVLNSFTGQPVDDDELLFAIPIVAPYQTLQNYKYKVKLTPGTSKRGRASKTALLMFSKDKLCSAREKDLLKGVKEESLARNLPGKVKLSAPQLQKLKKL